ncbi:MULTISPECIES: hypothetical protein [Roseobacteraceae]
MSRRIVTPGLGPDAIALYQLMDNDRGTESIPDRAEVLTYQLPR